MTILFSSSARVKSTRRPFAAGLVAPARYPWEAEIRDLLRSKGVGPLNVDAAVRWIAHRGTIALCPVVDRRDWPAVDAIVNGADAPVVEPTPEPAPAPAPEAPTRKPAPFQPSEADRAWWAEESARLEARRVHRCYDRRARRSYATDAVCMGLIPNDAADYIAAKSIVGHMA